MRKKSLKKKMMVYFISAIGVSFLAFFLITIFSSKNTIDTETNMKLSIMSSEIKERINSALIEQRVKAEIVANSIQTSYENLDESHFENILTKSISQNSSTYGMGIWFEPYVYDSKTYYAPYGYRDGDKISYMDYSSNFKNYKSNHKAYKKEDWYIKSRNKDKIAVWSDVYKDPEVNTLMVTVAAPMYKDDTFIGNVTSHIDLKSLSKMIESLEIGTAGRAFLIDSAGTYLTDKNSKKIEDQINISKDITVGLAEKSSEILEKRTGNFTFDDDGVKSKLYFIEIPETKWIVGIILPQKEVHEKIIGLIITLSIVALISILLLLFFIILFSDRITSRISSVSKLSESMATGDLTYKINIKGNDEIEHMANNFNHMSDKINTIIQKVEESLKEVLTSAKDLADIAQDTHKETEIISSSIVSMSEGAASQDDMLTQSVESVNEMNSGVEQISSSIQEMLAFAHETSNISNINTKDIVKVIKNMDEINKSTVESASEIHKLGNKSNEIGNIVSLITDISDQTNLLALNAAIEAARAGEQGKGFAVVAEEVRKLAEQSSEAASNISNLIGEIQTEIKDVVKSMDKSTSIVQEGTTLVRKSEKAFIDINSAISKIFDQIHEISSVTEELYATSSNVSDSMVCISNISKDAMNNTEEVSSNSEELLSSMNLVSESADKLTTLSNEIKEAFAFFKTK
ncbi:methyl-accepting chemotaxis protein [Oceanirhabdus sp. W0125-5]|uniref:methyl-accepting chemotaxis protein n=1 Tax=Oceanirhabdus sp. W0125-5 TaxID=2999116 RepID=UPI0022F3295F|nr:methyl-accepting chemotaxis protein [Oceanirhabdus sp. W0125-5]WBW96853.1 methyl-accepting chemotaxis protein [Oceanirhabdus sp. W0125-5]